MLLLPRDQYFCYNFAFQIGQEYDEPLCLGFVPKYKRRLHMAHHTYE